MFSDKLAGFLQVKAKRFADDGYNERYLCRFEYIYKRIPFH